MSETPTISDAKLQLGEVFDFLKSERDDVKKMASSGLSSLSADNAELNSFLVHDPNAIKTLGNSLTVAKGYNSLGDVLTVLINCATDATVAEAISKNKIVQRVMRLLDALERATGDSVPENIAPAFHEMSLMLLNNLTASSVVAVQDFLQVEDEDLAGFFVGRLHSHYARQPEVPREGERDLRKWYLQVVLNLTRTPDGQKCVLAEDWPEALMDATNPGGGGAAAATSSSNSSSASAAANSAAPPEEATRRKDEDNEEAKKQEDDGAATQSSSDDGGYPPLCRALAYQIFKNCSSVSDNHQKIVSLPLLSRVTERLSKGVESRFPQTMMSMAEILANLLQSESGMMALEEVNAKKYLVALVDSSSDSAEKAQEVPSGSNSTATKPAATVDPDTRDFLQKHVLPYLDDIQDAYVNTDN